jgi:hypothetical protein
MQFIAIVRFQNKILKIKKSQPLDFSKTKKKEETLCY